jgi:DNA-binding CsgD family transcriptional regulator
MNNRERWGIIATLFATAVFVGTDLFTDSSEGVRWWHLAAEGFIALAALAGVVFLLRDSFALKRSLAAEVLKSTGLEAEAEQWRKQAKVYIEGLAQEIERQLLSWKLTTSEKEVAFLLLKGLSLKEIAEIRKTSEKTARAQSTAIYEKSGLSGRSELAAFFLEDLLGPGEERENREKENFS